MLLDLAKAVEDIRCEYFGDVEALLHEVEVSPSVVWLEGRLIGPEPGASWRHGLDHRDEADGEGDEGARQNGEGSRALWCAGRAPPPWRSATEASCDPEPGPTTSTSESIAEAGRS